MPFYEFQCKSCGLVFEELVFHESIEQVLCPKCLGDAERVLSTFSISIPDEACAKLPKGEKGDLCAECRHGGSECPVSG